VTTNQRNKEMKQLADLEKKRRALDKQILALRKKLIRSSTRSEGAEVTISTALKRFGPLGFNEIVDVTGININTVKSTLRLMRAGERVIHENRKYSL
jgi:hypothetical protein